MKTMARGDFIEAENRINPDEATRSRQQRHFLFKKSYFHLLRKQCKKYCTTLQSLMNAKLSWQRFWLCHEARTCVETEGLADLTRFILIHTHSKGNLAWNSHKMWVDRWNHLDEPVLKTGSNSELTEYWHSSQIGELWYCKLPLQGAVDGSW